MQQFAVFLDQYWLFKRIMKIVDLKIKTIKKESKTFKAYLAISIINTSWEIPAKRNSIIYIGAFWKSNSSKTSWSMTERTRAQELWRVATGMSQLIVGGCTTIPTPPPNSKWDTNKSPSTHHFTNWTQLMKMCKVIPASSCELTATRYPYANRYNSKSRPRKTDTAGNKNRPPTSTITSVIYLAIKSNLIEKEVLAFRWDIDRGLTWCNRGRSPSASEHPLKSNPKS